MPGPDSYFLPALKDGPKHSMTYRAFETEGMYVKPGLQWLHDSLRYNGCTTGYDCVPWSSDCRSSRSTIVVAFARVWLGHTFVTRLQLVTTVCENLRPKIAMCTVSHVALRPTGCPKQIISSILYFSNPMVISAFCQVN